MMKTGHRQRIVRGLIVVVFAAQVLVTPAAAAGGAGVWLPAPGAMVGMSAAVQPVLLRGLTFDPADPMAFDFLIDPGDSGLSGEALKEEAGRLIRYFMTALTVPDDDLWVNLSPYEADRIIPDPLSRTEMGRDLLAQDYLLKQVAASLLYPEGTTGQAFWPRVYAAAGRDAHLAADGSSPAEVETLSKVWVMPDFAEVYEDGDTALILDSRLRVMTEADFLAREGAETPVDPAADQANALLREVLVPAVEREVNTGENFSRLRQMYHALVLAAWFKRNLRDHVLAKVYVGRNKTGGIDPVDPGLRQRIYTQYLAAFRQGVYNYIREDQDPRTQQVIPRRYFSGGGKFSGQAVSSSIRLTRDPARPRGFWAGLKRLGRKIFSARTRIEPAPIPGAADEAEPLITPELRESFQGYLADRRRLFDDQGQVARGRELEVPQPLRSMVAVQDGGRFPLRSGVTKQDLINTIFDGVKSPGGMNAGSRFSLETLGAGFGNADQDNQFAVVAPLNKILRPGYSYHYKGNPLREATQSIGRDAKRSGNYTWDGFRYQSDKDGAIVARGSKGDTLIPPEDLVVLVHAQAYPAVAQAIRERLMSDVAVDVEAAFAEIRRRMFVYDFSGLGEDVPDNQLDLAIGWLIGTAEGQRRFAELSGVDLQAVSDQVTGGHLLNRFDRDNVFLGWDYVEPELAELDAINDPDELHKEVERRLWEKGFAPEILHSAIDDNYLYVSLEDRQGEEVGRLVGEVDFANEMILFNRIWLDIDETRNKRIFPLLYRWFSSHPDFRERFRGYTLRVDDTTISSAKAWMRSGFVQPQARGDGVFYLSALFPDWQARVENEIAGSLTDPQNLVDQGRGNDADLEFAGLDAMADPDALHNEVDRRLMARGFSAEIFSAAIEDDSLYIVLKDRQGIEVGRLVGEVDSANKVIAFSGIWLDRREMHGRRLAPLLYRWFAAHEDFRFRFQGYTLGMDNTTLNSARAWMRSGFDSPQAVALTPDGRRFRLTARFPDWSARRGMAETEQPSQAPLVSDLPSTLHWRRADDLLILDQPDGQGVVTARYATLDDLVTEEQLGRAIEDMRKWLAKDGESRTTRALASELRSRQTRLWDDLPLVDRFDVEDDRLYRDLRLAIDAEGHLLGYVFFEREHESWQLAEVEVAPDEEFRGIGAALFAAGLKELVARGQGENAVKVVMVAPIFWRQLKAALDDLAGEPGADITLTPTQVRTYLAYHDNRVRARMDEVREMVGVVSAPARDGSASIVSQELRDSFREYLQERRQMFDAQGQVSPGRESDVAEPLRSMIAVSGWENISQFSRGLLTDTDSPGSSGFWLGTGFIFPRKAIGIRPSPQDLVMPIASIIPVNKLLQPGNSYSYSGQSLSEMIMRLKAAALQSHNYSWDGFFKRSGNQFDIMAKLDKGRLHIPAEDQVVLVHAQDYPKVAAAVRARLSAERVDHVEAAFAQIMKRMFVYDFSGLGEDVPSYQLDLAIGWLTGTAEGQRRFAELSGVDLQAVYDQVMTGHLLHRFDRHNVFLGWDYVEPELAELDAMTDPDELHAEVERRLLAKGFSPGVLYPALDNWQLSISLADRPGHDIGWLEGKVDFKNKEILFDDIKLVSPGARNQRIFPLFYRWFSSHPDFRERFRGYTLRVRITTISSAKAWLRSGFDRPQAIGDRFFHLTALFPDWPARAGQGVGARAPLAETGLVRNENELLILDQPGGQRMVSVQYTTLDTMTTEAALTAAIASMRAWRGAGNDTPVAGEIETVLRLRRERLRDGLVLGGGAAGEYDGLTQGLRLAVDNLGQILGYVHLDLDLRYLNVNSVGVAPQHEGRGLGFELGVAGLREISEQGNGTLSVHLNMVDQLFDRQIKQVLPDYEGFADGSVTLTPNQAQTLVLAHDARVQQRIDDLGWGDQDAAASSPGADDSAIKAVAPDRRGTVEFLQELYEKSRWQPEEVDEFDLARMRAILFEYGFDDIARYSVWQTKPEPWAKGLILIAERFDTGKYRQYLRPENQDRARLNQYIVAQLGTTATAHEMSHFVSTYRYLRNRLRRSPQRFTAIKEDVTALYAKYPYVFEHNDRLRSALMALALFSDGAKASFALDEVKRHLLEARSFLTELFALSDRYPDLAGDLQSNAQYDRRIIADIADLEEMVHRWEGMRIDELVARTQIYTELARIAAQFNRREDKEIITLGLGMMDGSLTAVETEMDFSKYDLYLITKVLVDNAIQAPAAGRDLAIKVVFSHYRDSFSLTVQDNGAGMGAEQLAKVRGGVSGKGLSTKGDFGSGQGLATVREIVSKYGGTMEVASELGVGTTFTLRFPIVSSGVSGSDTKGGVDFNPVHLDLRASGPGMRVDLPALEALINDPSFIGFRPVVVELVPVMYGQGVWGM